MRCLLEELSPPGGMLPLLMRDLMLLESFFTVDSLENELWQLVQLEVKKLFA